MKTAAAFILVFTAIAPLCQAGPIATFTAGTYSTSCCAQTLGWEFSVNSGVTVDRLFWYDPNHTLGKDFPVMMWKSDSSSVIPQTNVGSVSGTYDAATGYWRVAISPVNLTAGSTYLIAGFVTKADPTEWNIQDLTTSPAITFIEAVDDGSPSGLAFPGQHETCCGVAFIGANFGVVDTGVPEPGTWATLAAGLATLGAMLRRRRA